MDSTIRFPRPNDNESGHSEEWISLTSRHPAKHPMQWPEMWDLLHGIAIGNLGDCGAWTSGVRRERVIRPLLRGPKFRYSAFIPVGNEIPGLEANGSAESVIRDLVASMPRVDAQAVAFEEIAVESPIVAATASLSDQRLVAMAWLRPPQRSWLLRFPDDRSDYWAGFASDTRRKLRRTARKVGTDFRVFSKPNEVIEFLTLASEVSANSWQAQQLGVRIDSGPTAIEIETRLASGGSMFGMIQWHDQRPVAFVRAFLIGDVLFIDESGFAHDAASLRPGTALWVNALDYIIEHAPHIAMIDFGYGDAEYKERLGNHSLLRGYLVLTKPGAWIKSLARIQYLTTQGSLRLHGIRQHLRKPK